MRSLKLWRRLPCTGKTKDLVLKPKLKTNKKGDTGMEKGLREEKGRGNPTKVLDLREKSR